MFATLNSGKIRPFIKAWCQPPSRPKQITLRHFPALALILFCLGCITASLHADDVPNPVFAQRAEKAFLAAKARLDDATNSPDALWLFSRAAYDWADLQTTDARRKDIAEQGIAADRRLIAADPNSFEGHYYLGMNLGELAMTETIGALKLVREMEAEFILVLHTNAAFDNAGPDRNLGLLYRDCPGWPASIGNRAKAREHLQKAVVLTPGFPENLLNLIEAELKWGESTQALHDLKTLDDLWPKSHQQYTGEVWELSWIDWNKRRDDAHKKTGAAAAETTASSPHNK